MSNSPLVDYVKISPNKTSPRNHKIDTITIHCVVGQVTVERLGEIFAPTSRQASCNYGIGYDGKIGMYCEEKDRSWCSSSASNDNRAITIEVASDTSHPYAVTDKAYNALIELVADICKRNGIKELKWKANKSLVGQIDKQNMTVHRWFANKSCPGDYLYNRHTDIMNKVNAKLGNLSDDDENEPTSQNTKPQTMYKVQCGFFSSKNSATVHKNALKAKGFDGIIVQAGKYYRVQLGAFKNMKNAEVLLDKLMNKGFDDAFISHIDGSIINKDTPIQEGDKVKVLKAITYTGTPFKLYHPKYDVIEVKEDRIVIGIGSTVVAAVHRDNLKKVN